MTTRTMPRLILGIAAVVLGATFAFAGPIPSAHAEDSAPVMVVLDASGSMNAKDASGTRIAVAKKAVTSALRSVPSSAQIGLEVYGTSTGSADSDKAAGCRDVKVLQPVGPLDAAAMTAKVNSIVARGYTPIGTALRTAAKALPNEGPRSIVLVSDGIDTCAPPDPCAVAKELKAQGIDLVVHTVGFKVDDAARKQLACIATVTGGTYTDAGDGSVLASALDRQVTRALKPYSVQGKPIKGTLTPSGAPLAEPGQYLDTMPAPKSTSVIDDRDALYYRVRIRPNTTPYLAATLVPPPVRATADSLLIGMRLTPMDQQGSSCALTAFGDDPQQMRKVSPVTAVLDPGPVGGKDWPSSCPTSGDMVLRVVRSGGGSAGLAMRMELSVRMEPTASSAGLPGPSEIMKSLPLPTPAATATKITSGTSFNDAPVLQPGTYRDTIVTGETRFVAVPMTWGQRLSYRYDAGTKSVGQAAGVSVSTTISNPVRKDLTQPDFATTVDAFLGGRKMTLSGSSLTPIRYLNRTSSEGTVRPYSIDGTYYLRITAAFPLPSQQAFEVPYTLTLAVEGKADPAPSYKNVSGLPDTSKASAAKHADASSSTSAARDRDSSSALPVGLGIGAGVLVLGGAATALAVRARRHRATHS